MFKAMALSTCALALGLTACSKPADNAAAPAAGTSTAAAPAAAPADALPVTALVALAPTKDSKVSGTLTLSVEKTGGVSISGQVGNLEPGSKHGFHVHDKGDCSAPDGSSAGGHFNPTSMEHGDPAKADAPHHVGDMLNIEADATGTAQVKVTIPNATLHDGGPNDLVGRGIIVHAAPDDYTTQPSGNSGARLACGRIA
jgi:Cu-Zn family superoxide dismutase